MVEAHEDLKGLRSIDIHRKEGSGDLVQGNTL